jgi:hypothetical protein
MSATPEEVLQLAQTVHRWHRWINPHGDARCRYCIVDLDMLPVEHKPGCVVLVASRIIEGRLL